VIHKGQQVTSDITEQVNHHCRWMRVLCAVDSWSPSGCIEYDSIRYSRFTCAQKL